jgi:hypothetical protein
LEWEKEYENDASTVPDDLLQVMEDLVACYVDLVDEETQELLAAARGQKGNKAMTELELKKAHSVATKISKAKEDVTANFKAHGSPSSGLHKDHTDTMHGHLDGALKAMKAAETDGLQKMLKSAGDHMDEAMGCCKAYGEKVAKMHKSHTEGMASHIEGIKKAIGTEQEVEGDVTGPGAGDEEEKAFRTQMLKMAESVTSMADQLKKANERIAALETTPAPTNANRGIFDVGPVAREGVTVNGGLSMEKGNEIAFSFGN